MPTCDKSAVRFFGVHDLLVVEEDSGDEWELAEEPGSGSQQYFFIYLSWFEVCSFWGLMAASLLVPIVDSFLLKADGCQRAGSLLDFATQV